MKPAILAFTLAAVIAGCSPSYESIAPATAPQMSAAVPCDRVGLELQVLEAEQKHARSTDAVGILALGLPTGRMGGMNRKDQIADMKARARECGL